MKKLLILSLSICIFISCTDESTPTKNGIELRQISPKETADVEGYRKLNQLITRPGDILMTGIDKHRLVPVYKLNYTKKYNQPYIGYTRFYRTYLERYYNDGYYEERRSVSYFEHYMPGIEAVTGYNMLNISHYDVEDKINKTLFEKPVLINTVYYPSQRQDSLYDKPITRDC